MVTQEHFGLSEDNYMGSVVQFNKQHDNWSDFFFCNRIEPMVKRCVDKKLLATVHIKKLENLSSNMPALFDQERPSLLHGDLWSGNFLCDDKGKPVLIERKMLQNVVLPEPLSA